MSESNSALRWLIALSVMSSTFMEVLDTTVVNVSLPHIAGNLSASTDEATWVLTSYLVANAVVLPMTGWLANFFGRKRLLMTSVLGFTIASFFCGFATSLPMLIFFRIVQGACGGGLQPLSQAILMETFPPEERGKAMAFWALGIVVAPMLGPVLGGWLTDNYSWRWVFYINLPIGAIAMAMTQFFIFDPPYIRRGSGKIDYWGIGLLAVGIGALQIMLDKGQEEDWFGSHFIIFLAILSVACLVTLIFRELCTDHPIINLRVFKNRSYATGVFLMTVVGFVLYGSTVLLPLLMQTLLGYTATDAGLATLPRGLGSFIAMPLVGVMMGKIEARKILVAGIVLSTTTMYMFSKLSLDVGMSSFFWPLIIQGTAMGMLFIPITTLTNDPIPKEEMGNATSIFNLMRNIGASVGIASVTTMIARGSQKHINILGAHVSNLDPATSSLFLKMRAGFMAAGADMTTATQQAYAALWGMVQQQAAMLSYNDVFLDLAILFAIMLPLVWMFRKARHQSGEIAVH